MCNEIINPVLIVINVKGRSKIGYGNIKALWFRNTSEHERTKPQEADEMSDTIH